MVLAALARQSARIAPGIMTAFDAEIACREELRRIVKAADCDIAIGAVAIFEAQWRPACAAEQAIGKGRTGKSVRLRLPRLIDARHILECNRHATRCPLAHTAMAEIGVKLFNLDRVSNSSALAATSHFRHITTLLLPQTFPPRLNILRLGFERWNRLRNNNPRLLFRYPQMSPWRNSRRVIEGAHLQGYLIVGAWYAVPKPCPAYFAKAGLFALSAEGSGLIGLHAPRDVQLPKWDRNRHGKCTRRLLFAFPAMTGIGSTQWTRNSVAYGAALATA